MAPAVGAWTTVAELLDQWLARGTSSWAPTTVRNVRSIVDTHLKGRIGDMLVGDLTAAMVDDLYAKLRVDGRGDGQPLGIRTVHRVHSVLHAALAQAVRGSDHPWVAALEPSGSLSRAARFALRTSLHV